MSTFNPISGAGTSPVLDSIDPLTEKPAGPQAGSGGNGESPGAASSSSLEKEILNILAALTQELATLVENSQGLLQNNYDSKGGAPGISGGGPGSGNAPQPPIDAAEPPSDSPPPYSSAAAGALGPNVPSALQPFVQDINAASQQTGVPASLLGAQILQESCGNPNAVSTNPALGLQDTGLMQVDQATFQSLQQQYPSLLGGKSVSDPATNIMAGALLDAQLLKQNNGNIGAALTAYNGSADKNYVNEVTAKMNALQNGAPGPGGPS